MPFATTWMDIGTVILSEVKQTEKDKHITYVRNLKKQYTWTYLQNGNRVTGVENCYQGGGINGEIGIDIHTLICIQIENE